MRTRTLLLASAAVFALSTPIFAQADPHHADTSIQPNTEERPDPATPDASALVPPEGCPSQETMMGPGMQGMPMMQMMQMMESMQLTQKAMMETMQLMQEEMLRLKKEAAS